MMLQRFRRFGRVADQAAAAQSAEQRHEGGEGGEPHQAHHARSRERGPAIGEGRIREAARQHAGRDRDTFRLAGCAGGEDDAEHVVRTGHSRRPEELRGGRRVLRVMVEPGLIDPLRPQARRGACELVLEKGIDLQPGVLDGEAVLHRDRRDPLQGEREQEHAMLERIANVHRNEIPRLEPKRGDAIGRHGGGACQRSVGRHAPGKGERRFFRAYRGLVGNQLGKIHHGLRTWAEAVSNRNFRQCGAKAIPLPATRWAMMRTRIDSALPGGVAMRKELRAATILSSAVLAIGADVPAHAQAPSPYSWTGFYIGGGAGGHFGSDEAFLDLAGWRSG